MMCMCWFLIGLVLAVMVYHPFVGGDIYVSDVIMFMILVLLGPISSVFLMLYLLIYFSDTLVKKGKK